MENESTKLIAACWEMWGAIQQAAMEDATDSFGSLYRIAHEAMVRAGQLSD